MEGVELENYIILMDVERFIKIKFKFVSSLR